MNTISGIFINLYGFNRLSTLKKLLIVLLLSFAAQVYSQDFLQGVLYAKLKSNSGIAPKSSSANKIGVTEWHYVSHKAHLKHKSANPSQSGIEKLIKLHYNSAYSPQEAAKILTNSGLYEFVEPSPVFHPLYIPNDPFASDTFSIPQNGQIQLFTHTFWQAWDIEKGDTNVVIAIVDGGVNFNHQDLQGNIKINYHDPINGINDDGNYYLDTNYQLIDDYRGWDLGDWDNDPSNPPNSVHGTQITGAVCATADNGIGIVGAGFNSRYVHYKVAKDATPNNFSYGYDGLLMAAENGADVINLSWGALEANLGDFVNTANVILNYVVYELDVVVVAAAGNSSGFHSLYPAASIPVISVTGIRMDNVRQAASTYHYSVDINACSRFTRTTNNLNDSSYISIPSGTSIAAPLVTGAAALVRAHYPSLSAIQVNQLLRVTGDIVDTLPANKAFQYMMGRKLNPYRSLTEFPAAFRLTDFDSTLSASSSGDVVDLSIAITNYLQTSSSQATARLISLNPNIIVTDSIISIGTVAAFDTSSVSESFSFAIGAFTDTLILDFIIEYRDTNMVDFEYLQVTLIPDVFTGAHPQLEHIFTLAPNPASNQVSVRFINEIAVNNFVICDPMGKQLYERKINKKTTTLDVDLPTLPSGIYFISIQTQNRTYTQKLLIK